MSLKPLIISILSFLFFTVAEAQQIFNYRFINFTDKDGLADKYIYSITQDKKGYMWFGTGIGLYRYDGHSFKIFRSTADKPGRTISNILQSVYCDRNGILWLGSLNTLQWYNPEKGIFWSPDFNKPGIKKLADAYISNITEDKKGNVWLATNKDFFYRFNKEDSSFQSYRDIFPAAASKNTIKILEAGNSLWAVHSEGLYQFTKSSKTVSFYPFPSNNIGNTFTGKNENIIWLTTYGNGLQQFDCVTKKFSPAGDFNSSLLKNNLFCGAEDKKGNAWIGSYSLFSIDNKTNTLSMIQGKKESEFDLSASTLSKLFFDRENNLWIGSFNGLSMLPWQNQQVQAVPMLDNISKNTIEPTGVYEIGKNKDLLITNTTSKGLMYYDATKNELTTIINKYGGAITGIVTTPDGSLYASDGINYFQFLPETKTLLPFILKDQDGKPIAGAGRSCFDNNGNVYISSANNGFYSWSLSDNKLVHYNRWDIDKEIAPGTDNNMYPCLADSKGNIWFSSGSGIYEYNAANKNYNHYLVSEYSGVPLATETRFIAEDKQGHYWICTLNNGLYELYFDKGKETVKNYNKNSGNGIPSDYCLKIKPDNKDSSLWISFNTGIAKFDPVSKKVITVFNKQRGLFKDDAHTFSITGNNELVLLYFGWMNKINFNSFAYNLSAPQISFNSIKVFDKEYVYSIDNEKPVLHLKHKENFLQFEFSALEFNNSNQNKYAYQLEGADKDWIYSENRNSVTYSGLKDGTYWFKVKAANNDGVWGEEKRIKIIISPPFYATWWFILSGLLLAAGIVYLWNRHLISQARKEEKLKTTFQQQIAEMEMKALRAQMNPHFIFNSLNSIQKYILKNDHFAASQYLTKFSRLIRLILDHSNQNNILLSSEIELLKLYVEMESIRFDNKFDYAINIDSGINTETVEIPSMLIQPYIENAIWHGLLHLPAGETGNEVKGKLNIHIALINENNIKVTVEDNGIGRERSTELKSKQVLKKKSYGMQITEDRIAIINRVQHINAFSTIIDLKNKDGTAAGTKVILDIPVKRVTQ